MIRSSTTQPIRCWTALLLTGALLLAISTSTVAGPIHPPLQSLRSGHYQLISAEVDRVDVASSAVWVNAVETIYGEPQQDGLKLLMQSHDAAELDLGDRYLFVFTNVQRDSSRPRKFVRVDRNVVVHTDGADPAVFPDTKAWRHLLSDAHREDEKSDQYRARVIDGLSDDDPKAVDLWLAELVHRPATFIDLSEREIASIEAVVRDPEQRPTARSRALKVAMETAPAWGEGWYVDAAAELLTNTAPSDLASAPRLDQAVYSALTVLGVHATAEHRPALTRWLAAHDALAELAAVALARISPEVERDALRQALADSSTPADTQRMLSRRLAAYAN